MRNIVDSGSPLRLAPPRDGKRSREAPLLYTERDMSDAVRQAVQRGREEAAQEAEAYVRRLDRNVESALEAVGYLLEGLEAARRDMLDLASRELIELALMVARSVVGSEIELRPESIQRRRTPGGAEGRGAGNDPGPPRYAPPPSKARCRGFR